MSPEDRESFLKSLSPEDRAHLIASIASQGGDVSQLLSSLPPGEQAALVAGLVERGVDCKNILDAIAAQGGDVSHLTRAVAAAKQAQGRWHREYSGEGCPLGYVWLEHTREREELASVWDQRLFQMARVVHSSDDKGELMRIMHAPGLPHPAGINMLGHTKFPGEVSTHSHPRGSEGRAWLTPPPPLNV